MFILHILLFFSLFLGNVSFLYLLKKNKRIHTFLLHYSRKYSLYKPLSSYPNYHNNSSYNTSSILLYEKYKQWEGMDMRFPKNESIKQLNDEYLQMKKYDTQKKLLSLLSSCSISMIDKKNHLQHYEQIFGEESYQGNYSAGCLLNDWNFTAIT